MRIKARVALPAQVNHGSAAALWFPTLVLDDVSIFAFTCRSLNSADAEGPLDDHRGDLETNVASEVVSGQTLLTSTANEGLCDQPTTGARALFAPLWDSGGPATSTGRVVPPDAFCNHSTEKFRESIALAWKSLGH
jgi:hypothetical protein